MNINGGAVDIKPELKENYVIKDLTTFKIGGEIKCAYFPKTQQELVFLLNTLKDYVVLGNCSDVLISSDGYDGNIIFTGKISEYSINGSTVTASCGVKGPFISQKAAENSLSGFEFMSCFPGSIGGEIYMNASAHGQTISDNLVRCCVYNKASGQIEYLEKSEMNFGYRTSLLQNKDFVLLEAEFNLNKGSREDIEALMKRNIDSRHAVQPNLAHPNAGSVFKNPPNDSAGRLLDKAGAKSLIGDNVKVWDKHANFIVNEGNATSVDVLELMLRMKNLVKEQFTIELEPEIIYIGNKNPGEEKICKKLYKKIQK